MLVPNGEGTDGLADKPESQVRVLCMPAGCGRVVRDAACGGGTCAICATRCGRSRLLMIVVGRVSTLRGVPREAASFVHVREAAPKDECVVVVVDCEFRRVWMNGGSGEVLTCERRLCRPSRRPSILLVDRGVDDLRIEGGNARNDASSSAITLGTNERASGSSASRYDSARECSLSDRREWVELMNDDAGEASERVMNVAARGYLLFCAALGGENGGVGRDERILLDLIDDP